MGAGVLAQVGSGGFDANEFEVVQQLGRLTFQQVSKRTRQALSRIRMRHD